MKAAIHWKGPYFQQPRSDKLNMTIVSLMFIFSRIFSPLIRTKRVISAFVQYYGALLVFALLNSWSLQILNSTSSSNSIPIYFMSTANQGNTLNFLSKFRKFWDFDILLKFHQNFSSSRSGSCPGNLPKRVMHNLCDTKSTEKWRISEFALDIYFGLTLRVQIFKY